MNGNTHTIRRAIITGFALAAFVAAFVVSSALASGGNTPYGSHSYYTGAGTTYSDGSAAVMERHFEHEDSLYTSIPAAGSSTPVIHRSGFTWDGAAGIGAGAALALALIALAVGTLAVRAREGSKLKGDWNSKKRRRLARALERAAVPERPFVGRGPRYLVQPSVTAACAPSLRVIAARLRDTTYPIDDASLEAVQRFLTDASGPFYGWDSTAALREAVRVQHMVIGTETADFAEERVAVAV